MEAGLANPALLDRPELMESMGQFLQQTNIIRDIKEDWDEHRRFWPKQIWSKYVDKFEDLMKPEHREAALNCNAEMIHLALTRTDDCIFYLAGIKEQSVFNFCAIPQTMAIATLDVCFRNSGPCSNGTSKSPKWPGLPGHDGEHRQFRGWSAMCSRGTRHRFDARTIRMTRIFLTYPLRVGR